MQNKILFQPNVQVRLHGIKDTLDTFKSQGPFQTQVAPYNLTINYVNGRSPPNYPVPAIPTEVTFYHGYWGQYVALYQVLQRWGNASHLRLLKSWV